MIAIERAKFEKRERDKKRRRFILKIGSYSFHITRDEALTIFKELENYKKKGGI
ncbi:MAG: hypothetical protein QW051_05115 [Candidatus Aenigmatarchaeota archaeon]